MGDSEGNTSAFITKPYSLMQLPKKKPANSATEFGKKSYSSYGAMGRNVPDVPSRLYGINATKRKLKRREKEKRPKSSTSVVAEEGGEEAEEENEEAEEEEQDDQEDPEHRSPSPKESEEVEYDFDREDDLLPVALERTEAQAVYLAACSKLHVVPIRSFMVELQEETVHLRNRALGSDGIKACIIAFLESDTVKKIDLDNNGLGLDGAKYVAEYLQQKPRITELLLADNQLGGAGVKQIADVLAHSDHIKVLDFSGNNLDEDDATVFKNLITENVSLRCLRLNHNRLRERGGEVFSSFLEDNDSLEMLDLSWNHLRRRGIVAVCNALKLNKGLLSLDLSWNGMYLQGCRALGKALEENRTLEEINISCNRIDLSCLQELLPGAQKNDCLRVLHISLNPLTTDGALYLLHVLLKGGMPELQLLDMHTQSVNRPCTEMKDKLQRDRPDTVVYHGPVYLDRLNGDAAADDPFLHDDPMLVLMEYARQSGLRLLDVFAEFDKDQSGAISYDEFYTGLRANNLPLSDTAVQHLVKIMDQDGDGEITFRELLEGKKRHMVKVQRLRNREKYLENQEESTLVQVAKKVRKFLRQKQERMLKQMAGYGKRRAKGSGRKKSARGKPAGDSDQRFARKGGSLFAEIVEAVLRQKEEEAAKKSAEDEGEDIDLFYKDDPEVDELADLENMDEEEWAARLMRARFSKKHAEAEPWEQLMRESPKDDDWDDYSDEDENEEDEEDSGKKEESEAEEKEGKKVEKKEKKTTAVKPKMTVQESHKFRDAAEEIMDLIHEDALPTDLEPEYYDTRS